MVLLWMITVVSPRLMLLLVVVIVRVTLQEVSTVAAPMIIRATIAQIIFKIKDFMIGLFSSKITKNYPKMREVKFENKPT